jgi:hypothetical protein
MGSADMADDLEALLTHLRLSEISILGHTYETALKAVSAFFSGQTNPAQNDESLESFIDQVLSCIFINRRRRLPFSRSTSLGPSPYGFC